MAVPEPFNPSERVSCPQCHWRGEAREALDHLDEVLCCPLCEHYFVEVDIMPNPSELARQEGPAPMTEEQWDEIRVHLQHGWTQMYVQDVTALRTEVERLRAALAVVLGELEDVQPHLEHACYPDRRIYLDDHLTAAGDAAAEALGRKVEDND